MWVGNWASQALPLLLLLELHSCFADTQLKEGGYWVGSGGKQQKPGRFPSLRWLAGWHPDSGTMLTWARLSLSLSLSLWAGYR